MKKANLKKVILKLITSLILLGILFSQSVIATVANETELKQTVARYNDDNPESTAYLVTDEIISNVLPGTKYGEFKRKIEEGTEIFIPEELTLEDPGNNTPTDDDYMKTGMKIVYNLNNRFYDLSVYGDINGDSLLNQIDLTRLIRHLVNADGWSLEDVAGGVQKNIKMRSADMNYDKDLSDEDITGMTDYIVFDRLNMREYSIITKPEVKVVEGRLAPSGDRYETDVKAKVEAKDASGVKTIYKKLGSFESEYMELNNENKEINITEDGVYGIIAYTYGPEGNKSKGQKITIVREKKQCRVTYSPGEYGTFDEQSSVVPEGETVLGFNGTPTVREGYDFKGWVKEDGSPVGPTDVITDDIVLVPAVDAKKYTISYELNGGVLPEGKTNPTEFTIETETFTLNNPVKNGYEFLGWTMKDKDGVLQEGEPKNPEKVEKGSKENRTYIANWEGATGIAYNVQIYKMKLDGTYPKESELTSANIDTVNDGKTGETKTLSDEYILGKAGVGFEYDSTNQLNEITKTIKADGSTVFKLYYKRKQYNLTIEAGTGISNVTGIKNGSLTGAATTTETAVMENIYYDTPVQLVAEPKEGYTTVLWASNNTNVLANSKLPAFNMPVVPDGTTLKVTATAVPLTYEIEYDYDGGALETGVENPTEYTVETREITIHEPTKDGYDFQGWKFNQETEIKSTRDVEALITSGEVRNKITLKAQWTPQTGIPYEVHVYRQNEKGQYTAPYVLPENGEVGEQITIDETKRAEIEAEVERREGANGEKFAGFTYDENNSGRITEGRVSKTTKLVLKLYYKRNQYSMTLKAGTGINRITAIVNNNTEGMQDDTNKIELIDVYYNAPIKINGFEKTGYTFIKWESSNADIMNDVAEQEKTIKMPIVPENQALTLTAKATANTNTPYSVMHIRAKLDGTYDENDAEFVEIQTTNAAGTPLQGTTGEEVTAVAKTYPGFTVDETKSANTRTGIITGDGTTVLKIYYSREEYRVTVNTSEGIESVTGAGTYKYGAEVTVGASTLEGYTFDKWTSNDVTIEEAKQGNNPYKFNMPSKNVTITANTGLIEYILTVKPITYYRSNGEWNPEVSKFGGEVQIVGEPTNTGVEQTKNMAKGTSFTVVATPNDNYDFIGWYYGTEEKTKEISYTDTMPIGNYTLNACFMPKNCSVTVNYYVEALNNDHTAIEGYETKGSMNINGKAYGDVIKPIDYDKASEITEANQLDHVELGDGTIIDANSLYTIKGNTVINIYYTRKQYTLTLEKGTGIAGVAGTNINQNTLQGTYYIGQKISINATLLKGYKWTKWTKVNTDLTEIDVTIEQNPDIIMPGENAKLKANGELDTYTITYDLQGGSMPEGQTNPPTYDITKLPITLKNPEKPRYTFEGWTAYIGDTVQPGLNQVPEGTTGNITFVANWAINGHTLTVQAETGGTISTTADIEGTNTMKSGIVSTGTEFSVTATPGTGYIFDGWYIGTTKKSENATYPYTMPDSELTLIAKFKVATYTIVYNANATDPATGIVHANGTMTSQTANVGYSVGLKSNNFTRNNMTFKGWSTSPTATSPTYVDGEYVLAGLTTEANKTITLYAVWDYKGWNETLYLNTKNPTDASNTSASWSTGGWSDITMPYPPVKTISIYASAGSGTDPLPYNTSGDHVVSGTMCNFANVYVNNSSIIALSRSQSTTRSVNVSGNPTITYNAMSACRANEESTTIVKIKQVVDFNGRTYSF